MDLRALASVINVLGKAALLCFLHLASTASESGQEHFSTITFISVFITTYQETNLVLLYELTCDCLACMENVA